MSTSPSTAGYKLLLSNILNYITSLLDYAMRSDYSNAKRMSEKIHYDAVHLQEFIQTTQRPSWLGRLIALSHEYHQSKINANEMSKIALEINALIPEAKMTNWDIFVGGDSDIIDTDKTFQEFARASKLEDAIEQLIKCLELIKNESEFKLSKQTKIDITAVINGLRTSVHASESCVQGWVGAATALVKAFVPQIDQLEKWHDFLYATADAIDHVTLIVLDAKNKVHQKFLTAFCNPDIFGAHVLPKPKPLKEQLLLTNNEAESNDI